MYFMLQLNESYIFDELKKNEILFIIFMIIFSYKKIKRYLFKLLYKLLNNVNKLIYIIML